ncbi:MAG: nicotinamide riboside transporter PnuC [Bacteroidales bacterium]|nr:nicotinamide riboside transporter PnuC [Bacteroidales bacterium]
MKRETYNKYFSIFILAGMTIAVVLTTIFKLNDTTAGGKILLLVSAFGSIMGVMSAVTSASGKIITFLFSLLDVLIYGAMCFVNWRNGGAGLGNGILHLLYFVPMQFIGFSQWRKRGANSSHSVTPRVLSKRNRILYGVLFAVGSVVAYLILVRFDKSLADSFIKVAVVLDVLTIMCNIFGQILLSTAYVEQWIFWMGVNVSSIFIWAQAMGTESSSFALIYLVKYGLYLLNSIHGFRLWLRMLQSKTLQNE